MVHLCEIMSGKRILAVFSVFIAFLLVAGGSIQVTRSDGLRDPTSIDMYPSSFDIDAGENITIRAELTSNGTHLEGKTIEFSTTNGNLNPLTTTTNATGIASTTFTAPKIKIQESAKIKATYLGSTTYQNCTNTTDGSITPIYEYTNESGASFSVPKSIDDDIDNYREGLNTSQLEEFGIDVPTEEFILAKEEYVSIVLADKSDKGFADVEGWVMPTNITLENTSVEVIIADNVTITKVGEPATIDDILSTPSQYKLDLVQIESLRRQISILCDPDTGNDLDVPITSGYLTNEAEGAFSSIIRAIDKAKNLTVNSSRSEIRETLNITGDGLPVFDFETDYWYNSTVKTNAIVLPQGTPVLDFLKDIIPNGSHAIELEENSPVLYDVKTSFSAHNISSVEEIYNDTEQYRNEVISLEAKAIGGTISVQESLEHYTSCDEDRFPVPTPSGPICVNIPVDVLLEGGVAWNHIEFDNFSNYTLLTAGASSKLQEEPYSNYSGEYRLIGKLVPISFFNQTKEVYILQVYERKKTEELDYNSLGKEIQNELEEEVKDTNSVLTDFTNITLDGVPTGIVNTSFSGISEIPESIEFSNELKIEVDQILSDEELDIGLNNFYLSRFTVSFDEDQTDVTVEIEKVDDLTLSTPVEKVYQSFDISLGGIDDSEITNATLGFSLCKDWMEKFNFSKEDIEIYRYHEGEWEDLSVSVHSETESKIYYRANSPGFSKFTIGAQSGEEDKEDPIARAGDDIVVEAGKEFTLNASESSDNVGITEYVWDMDNGQTKFGEQCSFTYEEPGNYTVTLTVRDEAGNSDMDTIKVSVKEPSGGAEDEDDGGMPGFTFGILLVSVSIVSVYLSKVKKE